MPDGVTRLPFGRARAHQEKRGGRTARAATGARRERANDPGLACECAPAHRSNRQGALTFDRCLPSLPSAPSVRLAPRRSPRRVERSHRLPDPLLPPASRPDPESHRRARLGRPASRRPPLRPSPRPKTVPPPSPRSSARARHEKIAPTTRSPCSPSGSRSSTKTPRGALRLRRRQSPSFFREPPAGSWDRHRCPGPRSRSWACIPLARPVRKRARGRANGGAEGERRARSPHRTLGHEGGDDVVANVSPK